MGKVRSRHKVPLRSVAWRSSLLSSSGISSPRHVAHTMTCWRWRTCGWRQCASCQRRSGGPCRPNAYRLQRQSRQGMMASRLSPLLFFQLNNHFCSNPVNACATSSLARAWWCPQGAPISYASSSAPASGRYLSQRSRSRSDARNTSSKTWLPGNVAIGGRSWHIKRMPCRSWTVLWSSPRRRLICSRIKWC